MAAISSRDDRDQGRHVSADIGLRAVARPGTVWAHGARRIPVGIEDSGRPPVASYRVPLRKIALPAEHGSWGLVLEPIVLGLLVAPSIAGVALGCGALGAFLARRPLKIVLTYGRRERSRRTLLAQLFLLAYGLAAALGLAVAVSRAGLGPLLPVLVASPLAAVFLAYDLRNDSRTWQAELAGAVLFATVACAIALVSGWHIAPALALTAVLAARGVPSILYVRARIRLDRGRPYDGPLVIAAHVLALALVAGLILTGLLSSLVLLAFLALCARALVGLSRYRRRARIQAIGFLEMGLGVLTVLAVAVGYWSGVP